MEPEGEGRARVAGGRRRRRGWGVLARRRRGLPLERKSGRSLSPMIRALRPTHPCTSSTRRSRSPLSTGPMPPVLCSAPPDRTPLGHTTNCRLFIRTESNPVAKIYSSGGLINGDYFQLIEENESRPPLHISEILAKLAGRPRLPGRRSTTSARSSQFSFPARPPSSFSTVSCSPAPSSPSALLRRRRERPRVSQLVCATPPPPGTSVRSQLVCGAPPPPGTSARIPAPRPLSSSPVTPSRLRGAKLEYVIGRSDEDLKTPFGIKMLDKLTQTWVVPTVVGA